MEFNLSLAERTLLLKLLDFVEELPGQVYESPMEYDISVSLRGRFNQSLQAVE